MKSLAQYAHGTLISGALAVAVLPLSCSRAPQTGVLATVGARQITTEDFKKEIERRRAAHRPVPDKETLLQEMVTFEALLQRARSAGLFDDPQTQHEISSLLVNKLQERELAPRLEAITITPEELRADYEKNIARYTRPEKLRLAVLALMADPKATGAKRAELRDRLEEARQKILATPLATDFGQMAIEYSDDQASRYRGGDMGWLDAGNFTSRWPREVLEAGFALDKKQVSPVIETKEGAFLVMKTDTRPGWTVPLAEVDGTLRQSLAVRKRQQLEADFRAEAVQRARATIHREALAALELQVPPMASVKPNHAEPPAFPAVNGNERP